MEVFGGDGRRCFLSTARRSGRRADRTLGARARLHAPPRPPAPHDRARGAARGGPLTGRSNRPRGSEFPARRPGAAIRAAFIYYNVLYAVYFNIRTPGEYFDGLLWFKTAVSFGR